jgi:TetR/AcrR family transcriptional regulator, tetracycline repressor protein
MSASESAAPKVVQRGRPRQISRERIVSAARGLAPDGLTMQAVADALGVDPKALNYHVCDRDALREMVALDVFESELSRVALGDGGDWRDVLRTYANALRDAVVELGVLVAYFRLPASGMGALEPVERVLRVMVDAGFTVEEAGHALRLVTEIGHSAGREAVFLAQSRVPPNVPEVTTALEGAADGAFPVLQQVIAGRNDDVGDHHQLEFSMKVVVAGLENLLSST